MADEDIETLRNFYMARNCVFLAKIDRESTGEVIADLARVALTNPEHIDLVICSSGGVTDMGFAIAQFIEYELRIPVHARVFGMCHSAATYPLLSCKKRVGNELSTFVIHRQTTSIEIDYSNNCAEVVAGWQAENEATHKRQLRFYSRKLKKSVREVELLLNRGSAPTNNELSAKEALELGLLTEVVPLSIAPR